MLIAITAIVSVITTWLGILALTDSFPPRGARMMKFPGWRRPASSPRYRVGRCEACGVPRSVKDDPVHDMALCDPCWSRRSIRPAFISLDDLRTRFPATMRRLGR